jgi:hypothetical protein
MPMQHTCIYGTYFKHNEGLFGYFRSMWIRVDWVGLRCILTYYGFKPTRYHPIHMDTHQNEQALRDLKRIVDLPIHLCHQLLYIFTLDPSIF